ncbi:hypothetical protein VFPPC_17917 [Pochonia chlamydosporia 170]|uniref:Uncharacterized protein n=1 Tax=Pochonia chlamydosporia 170 TaxID=1380566 RepID=A0A219AQ15_METCM|nr:hypothetical protein VFPPC_17917 [Pochonia chlamydosporia 170]OWT42890.1 hypothetical protein VFPPC_17917 [Pochonia chlamydosporia 170]
MAMARALEPMPIACKPTHILHFHRIASYLCVWMGAMGRSVSFFVYSVQYRSISTSYVGH